MRNKKETPHQKRSLVEIPPKYNENTELGQV